MREPKLAGSPESYEASRAQIRVSKRHSGGALSESDTKQATRVEILCYLILVKKIVTELTRVTSTPARGCDTPIMNIKIVGAKSSRDISKWSKPHEAGNQ